MVGLGGAFQKQVADGTVRFVVDPSSPASAKYFPHTICRDRNVRHSRQPQEQEGSRHTFRGSDGCRGLLVEECETGGYRDRTEKNSAFDGQDLAALTSSATYDQPFMAPSLGFVSEGLWKSTLKQLAYWGLPNVDLSSDDFSYAKRVDMSYLDAAKNIKITP